MRQICLCALVAFSIGLVGCAAPLTEQINSLDKTTACCQAVTEIKPAGNVDTIVTAALTQNSPLILVDGKRTPAMLYSVSADLAGKALRVRVAPSEPSFGVRETLRFAPIAVMFLDAKGNTLASSSDSGLRGGPAESFAYSYALWRQVTIPATAVSVVFYADPALYGTRQRLDYRYGGIQPVAGILIAGTANAHAEYAVYGEFLAKVISL
jgi:hypothetical protein